MAFYALCDYDASPPKQYIVVTLIAIVWKITSPSKRLVTGITPRTNVNNALMR